MLDITVDALKEWARSKDPDEVIHSMPYTRRCTINTYIRDKGLIKDYEVITTFGEAWGSHSWEGDDLPEEIIPVMQILDRLCDVRDNSYLTAGDVLEVLENLA